MTQGRTTVGGAASVVAFLAAAAGGMLLGAAFPPGSWYEALVKPGLTPPSWVFPVVWTPLYLMIAAAGWLLWRAPTSATDESSAPPTLGPSLSPPLASSLPRNRTPSSTTAEQAAVPARWRWVVQYALNLSWSPIFFGVHRPDLALVVIVLLWLAIGWTIAGAWREHVRSATLLLVPYWAWVGFASLLNFEFWRMNMR